jgi:hypothetical protein
VKLKSIVQGRDFGSTIEILSGIGPDDKVIVNPPDSLTDGVVVRIAAPAVAASKDTNKSKNMSNKT